MATLLAPLFIEQKKSKALFNWPRGYKTFFMLNSVEHEIFSANKYENANNSWHFLPTIVGIFTFISRENLMLSYV